MNVKQDEQLNFWRYQRMYFFRRYDELCVNAYYAGEIHGEYHSGQGQESTAVALEEHVRPDDAVVSTHRNDMHALAKGVPLDRMFGEVVERVSGTNGGFGAHMHIFDQERHYSATGTVGANIPVALGQAYAAKLDGRDSIGIAMCGDGSVNTGACHESLIIAGDYDIPLMLIVENNGYGISERFEDTSPTPTICQRAVNYGGKGWLVDGIDIIQTSRVMGQAMEWIRIHHKPVILEVLCHRMRGHFEGDTDTYRDADTKRRMVEQYDPVSNWRNHLIELYPDSLPRIERLEQSTDQSLRKAYDEALMQHHPDLSTARMHVFASGLRNDQEGVIL
jgi:pyruvate dehydrogenase E1 component alpha subunit